MTEPTAPTGGDHLLADTKKSPPPFEFVKETDAKVLEYLTMILFGPSGVGKTTGAWSAPAPVLALTTEPDRRTRFARRLHVEQRGRDIRESLVKNRKQLEQGYLYARNADNGIETVVIDTVAQAYRLALEYEMGNPNGKPSLPNHGDATAWLERYLRHWMELPLNVVLVCHELIVQEGETTERIPRMSTNQPGLALTVESTVDVAAYCGVVPNEEGGASYVAQVVPAGGRHVKDGTGYLANGTEPIPLDLSAWLETFHAAYAEAVPKESVRTDDDDGAHDSIRTATAKAKADAVEETEKEPQTV
jgi:hypothetical protein